MSFALYYNDLEPHFISQPPFIHTPQSRIVSASKGDQYPYALSPKSKCKPFSHFLSGFSSPHILSRTSLLRNSRVYQKLRGAFIPPPFFPCFIFISNIICKLVSLPPHLSKKSFLFSRLRAGLDDCDDDYPALEDGSNAGAAILTQRELCWCTSPSHPPPDLFFAPRPFLFSFYATPHTAINVSLFFIFLRLQL